VIGLDFILEMDISLRVRRKTAFTFTQTIPVRGSEIALKMRQNRRVYQMIVSFSWHHKK